MYVSDAGGDWRGDRATFVARALERAPDGLAELVPADTDAFLYKPGYSAFRETALVSLLRERRVERVLLAGAAAEMCVTQTAIDARGAGLKVTILRDACAHADPELCAISLRYVREIAGGFVADVEEWVREDG